MTADANFDGEYEPSKWDWVAEQVELYESTNGAEGATLRDSGLPIIVMTTVGHKSGKVRKVPVMKVEHEGEYAVIASVGGRPKNPGWFHNLVANPTVLIQDGPEPFETEVRIVEGDERAAWWERAVAAFSPYAEYQAKTDRVIPVFVTRARV